MKSIFMSRSRVKPKWPQNDSKNDPKIMKAAFFGSLAEKNRGDSKKKKGIGKETRPFNGPCHEGSDVINEKGLFWTAPASLRAASSQTAFANERCWSEYSLRSSGLQTRRFGHCLAPETPFSGDCFDLGTELETNSKHRDKGGNGGRPFSSWFGQTLQYVFETEKEDRNEIRVLALGIRQFIDEVFDSLDDNKNGYVQYEDFRVLCALIGKDLPARDDCEKCLLKICTNQMCASHVHYLEFREKIQSLFQSDVEHQNISDYRNNDKLIETVAKISRRTKSLKYIAKLLEEIEEKIKSTYATESDSSKKGGHSLIGLARNGNQRGTKIIMKNLVLQRQVLLQLQEIQCLREIVEDFRVALQISDAENLALRVTSTRDKPCKECSADRNNLRQLSFPNEDDSIDRMIIDFPSSETLLHSDLNLLKLASLEGGRAGSSSSQHCMESQFRSLLDRSYEDLDIQYELEDVYRELFETKEKMTELKLSLDRNKTRELNEAALKINKMSEEMAEAIEEKKKIEEEMVRYKSQLEERDAEYGALTKEIEEMKARHEATTNEMEESKWNLKRTKQLRKQELKQFSDLRALLSKALIATRDSQTGLNNINQSFQDKFTVIESKGDSCQGRPNISHHADTSWMVTSEYSGKRKISEEDEFSGLENLETYDNVDSGRLYRVKLKRQTLQEEIDSRRFLYRPGREGECDIIAAHSSSERENKDVLRKKTRKDVTRHVIAGNNLARFLPSPDIKPILEVKPNIIKPWITLDQSSKVVDDGILFGKGKANYGNISSSQNDLEFAKISSELCKEITKTFAILNESDGSMESNGPRASRGSIKSIGSKSCCSSMESYGSKASCGSLESYCSKASCDSLESHSFMNFFNSGNTVDSCLVDDAKEIERKVIVKEDDKLGSYDFYGESGNYKLDYESLGAKEISAPFKFSTRSSTQILESLEFEVDLLRKSLEEENLWR